MVLVVKIWGHVEVEVVITSRAIGMRRKTHVDVLIIKQRLSGLDMMLLFASF